MTNNKEIEIKEVRTVYCESKFGEKYFTINASPELKILLISQQTSDEYYHYTLEFLDDSFNIVNPLSSSDFDWDEVMLVRADDKVFRDVTYTKSDGLKFKRIKSDEYFEQSMSDWYQTL